MKLWATLAVLGLLVMGTWAQVVMPTISLPPCDAPEAEAAALVAEKFLNAQHTHGYKYALNQIDKIKIVSTPGKPDIYRLELDFLETTCHVLDPTPVSQCPVRQKRQTAVEADCDFALSNTTQGLAVVSFKCKTELESFEDICLGCRQLIALNDTDGVQLIRASLDDFNKNHTLNTKFSLFEIGRIASQVVSGGNRYFAEYAIIATNCTSHDEDVCIPQNHATAIHGFCQAEGSANLNQVACKIFDATQAANATVPVQPALHAHTSGPHYDPAVHADKHHKVTRLHDPAATGLLSAESAESAELVVPKAAPVVKREVAQEPADAAVPEANAPAPDAPAPDAPAPDAPAPDAPAPDAPAPGVQTPPIPPAPVLVLPVCPGMKKHF
ncbi:alpha-2-HS-glycoprotein 2 [Paramisgurnus dabryanus]|uniref:alpha-2-HS-glycoprotein 2 n=1 Tax=Paramisgurnus dabryanus TaxID=90735 RepID=UPI0031F41FB3